jgi:dTDP-4-dehydrorhamnose 3,5-epimerase
VIFRETRLAGAFVIEPERLEDERGLFARTFCVREFQDHGLNPSVIQCNISHNRIWGTVRGLHYQVAPHAEARLVRCTAGAIFDVIADLRSDSPTYLQHLTLGLSAENRTMLYVPEGFAHGFQTLHDGTEVFYQMSAAYAPEYARGVRWNDPALAIRWPLPVRNISERDADLPLLEGGV